MVGHADRDPVIAFHVTKSDVFGIVKRFSHNRQRPTMSFIRRARIVTTFPALVLFLCQHSFAQWLRQEIPSGIGMLLTVDFSDSLRGASSGYRPGFHGSAIYTTDGGVHWERATVPDSSRSLVTLQMINSDTGYIAGAYNVPAGSGIPSSSFRDLPTHRPLARGMERFLQSIGYVPGDEYRALFLRTTDGGKSWHSPGRLPDSLGYLLGASFVDARTGYITGDGLPSLTTAVILKTTDGGAQWLTLRIPDSIATLRNICALDADHVIAVGYENAIQGVIVRTTDGGLTWDKEAFPAVDNFTDLSFSHPSVGYAVGVSAEFRAVVYKTSNSGESWHPVSLLSDTTLLEVVRFLPGTDEGIIAGEQLVPDTLDMKIAQPFSARTTKGGVAWVNEDLPGDSIWTVLVGADLLSPGQAYLAGGDGGRGVMYRFHGDGTVSVSTTREHSPARFELFQNYPNPFNPKTEIRSQLSEGRHVRLVVYDLLGREVAVLVDEWRAAGSYRDTFSSSGGNRGGLASGIYIYRLIAGSFVASRQMILLR